MSIKKQLKKKQGQEGKAIEAPLQAVFPEIREHGHRSRECLVMAAKMEREQVEHWIRFLTGMSGDDLMELRVSLAIEWLSKYLDFEPPRPLGTPPKEGNRFDVEADVYRLLANEVIYGWWMNEYATFDKGIVEDLKRMYRDWSGLVLEAIEDDVISTSLNDRSATFNDRLPVQGVKDEIRRKYIAMHWGRMQEGSEAYKKLEDSYAAVWKLIN